MEEYLNHYKLPAWKELPDIGLYMDQVIALLAQYLDFIPVEDQSQLTTDFLQEVDRRYQPERVLVEYNGMCPWTCSGT